MKARNEKKPRITEKNTTTHYATVKSPIGELLLVADVAALTGIYFAGRDHVPAARKGWALNAAHPVLRTAEKQLEEYFAGKRTAFSVPLRLTGTDFQEKVWQQIGRIPYGETISYTDLAERVGAPQAARAAGTSTGRNPVSIIIPCHRVVGKTGNMCGYAGGLARKQFLLEHEASKAPAKRIDRQIPISVRPHEVLSYRKAN